MHNYSHLTFSEVIPDVVKRFSNYNALRFVGETPITYLEMGKQIEALKAFVEKLGIKPGDKVVIYILYKDRIRTWELQARKKLK
ncbi:MAG: hypothetical protein PHX26_07230, partial [Proteiniphilum sp.]|nr:hypothetical protein [Proteiniphilum sp.]